MEKEQGIVLSRCLFSTLALSTCQSLWKESLSLNSVPSVESLKESVDNGPLEMTEVILYTSRSHWNDIFSCKPYQILFPVNAEALQTCLPGNTDPGTFSFQNLVKLALWLFSGYCLFAMLWYITFSLYSINWITNVIIE